MKKINLYQAAVFGTFVVFICNMAISYLHALVLFQEIGNFPGIFAHIAVIAFDTVFALSVLIISTGLMRKSRIGWQVWAAFLFGLFMTSWSNIRASMGEEWIYLVTGQFDMISAVGWESLIAGASTPTALVSVEFLLAWMVSNKETFVRKMQSSLHTITTTNASLNIDEQVDDDMVLSSASSYQTERNFSNERRLSSTEEITQDTSLTIASTEMDALEDTENSRYGMEINASEENVDLETIIEIAKTIERQQGKLPGRVKLAKAANCKPYRARRALEILKKEQQAS